MPARALRLAITGGIGSGKSTVASLFVNLGAFLVDADALSHELTAPRGAAIGPIIEQFGASVLTQDGALDRTAMRTRIFADPLARRTLEFIMHPLVAQLASVRGRDAERAGFDCVLFDIPLLAESSDWRQRVDRILVVDCDHDVQIKRVMNRSALSRTTVEAIIAAQASRERRLRCADCVIDNTHVSLATLAFAVKDLATGFGL